MLKRVLIFYLKPQTENDNFNPKNRIVFHEEKIKSLEKKYKNTLKGKIVFNQLVMLASFQMWVLEKRASNIDELYNQIDLWLRNETIFNKENLTAYAHQLGYDFNLLPKEYFYLNQERDI